MSQTPAPTTTTQAYLAQTIVAFSASLLGFAWAMLVMPMDPWARAFFVMTGLCLVSSTFSLSKTVRDMAEQRNVAARIDAARVDAARVDKILTEHDPFRSVV